MNKLIYIITIAITALLLLTSCAKDNSVYDADEEQGCRAMVTCVKESLTRARDNSWAPGDAIGVFVLSPSTGEISPRANNLQYVTGAGDGIFTPATPECIIYLPNSGSVDVMGYYPYSSDLHNSESNHPVFAVADWEDQSNGFEPLDLLVSQKVTGRNASHPDVNLQMKHQFCKLVFEILPNTDKGVQPTDLEGLTATVSYLNRSAECDLLAGNVSVNTSGFASEQINLFVSADGTLAQCLVAPQNTPSSYASDRPVLSLTIPKYNKTMTYQLPANKTFASGNCYKWTLMLSRKNVEMIGTYRIVDWDTLDPMDDVAGFDYKDPDGGAVDLGLPSGTWWATCNLGANSPEEEGDLYAWGEVETKYSYTSNNYKWGIKPNISKYCTSFTSGYPDMKQQLENEDDAAWVNTNKRFRMPTKEEAEELWNLCEITRIWPSPSITLTGPNGKRIIIPSEVWTSTIVNEGDSGSAYSISTYSFGSRKRYSGYSIRPVLNQ